ncbi:glycerophosphodiester phosphodiesterase [Anaeromyxobacter oryzae]|uniref:Glycerophosphoryl diester phosphodiesterase n=1 Tax=Anaeromyxobacter oryzae TaxID=2918170 RepID=A0ABM7WX61_9BACT|nr:glycerophosphodiester phosphodiesterase [Anaeromyxobacter oryzae]BDG04025.1 glycerophosphoryl diester phosphodiesterase [Anaeromyxobacter oryzae]
MTSRPHRPYLDRPGPWLVAHRGGSLLAPENTLAAFDRAVALGADAIETDVHLARDGVVVVFHDDETTRLTGAPGTIETRTYPEVAALDAGFSFTPDGGRTFPHRGRGLHPPAFSDVLARYPSMRFNVDAKSEDPALAAALARTIQAAGAEARVCVGSFSDAQAGRLGALLPECARYLPEQAATCHVMAAKTGQADAACPEDYDVADLPHRLGELVVVDAPVVAWFHARGMPVHVWTVDDEAEMRALLALGVDGIVTDRPDVLAGVLGR